MKTLFKILKNVCLQGHWPAFAILVIISNIQAISQPSSHYGDDYLKPRRGRSLISLNTGIPYIGIGEFSYGVSDRFSVGLLYGYTPIVLGYGLKIKALVAHPSPTTAILFKAPLLYYPHAKNLGGDPWVLAWPSLSFEKKLESGHRIWFGMGAVGASCVDALLGLKKTNSVNTKTENKSEDEGEIMKAVWNTISVGYSMPWSKRLFGSLEVSPVLKGLKLAGSDWIAGPPVIITLGLSYTL